jgi:pyruvate dehydrogenase E2 component (dihydrolipoamide acetyltransferase)
MAEIIEMPKLSDTMTVGTLVKWLVREGDPVKAGAMIAEVETDKATMEVENFEDGTILKLYAKEGEQVAIGDPICAVGKAGEQAPAVGAKAPAAATPAPDVAPAAPAAAAPAVAAAAPVAAVAAPVATPVAAAAPATPVAATPAPAAAAPLPANLADSSGQRLKISPLARKVAADKGIDPRGLTGTGPGGRIVKADIEAAALAPRPAAAAAVMATPLPDIVTPVTNMRAAIARALVTSKTTAPHFYLQMEIDGEPLSRAREALNTRYAKLPVEQGGIKFTVNDLIMKAAAAAVLQVPAINRSWQGDKIVQYGSVQLAFGVAIDDGLVTPVIRDAQFKTLHQISTEAKELIGKARNRKLKPDEMSGSTLTVTNLGMFGISDFYGIINPGNAAILSVGATVTMPVVDAHGNIVVGQRMKIGLSGDHRVIDGAVGAQYLAALRTILENPMLMLV